MLRGGCDGFRFSRAEALKRRPPYPPLKFFILVAGNCPSGFLVLTMCELLDRVLLFERLLRRMSSRKLYWIFSRTLLYVALP